MPASCPGGLKSPGRGRQRIPQTGGSIASIAILWPYSRFPLQLPDPARHLRPSPAGGDGRELCAVVASQRLARGQRHRLRKTGRASCWERGWQYVEIRVVGGSIKNKKT